MQTTQAEQPITYVIGHVTRPNYALTQHIKLQQHVSAIMDQPDARRHQAIVAIKRWDLDGLFDDVPKEFYLVKGEHIAYVYLRPETSTDDPTRFANLIRLSPKVVKIILDSDGTSFSEAFGNPDSSVDAADLRMTALMDPSVFADLGFQEYVTVTDLATYDKTPVTNRFVRDDQRWVAFERVEEDKPMLLSGVHLMTRNNRNLVRQALSDLQERGAVITPSADGGEETKTVESLEVLAERHGVYLGALRDMEAYDKLPNEEYVVAMNRFKQAEVQKYHAEELAKDAALKPLHDWVMEAFGQPFETIGIQDALNEIGDPELSAKFGFSVVSEADSGEHYDDAEPGVFVVAFDGCIVEDQRPIIGPESPYAVGTLRALQKTGNALIIYHNRATDDLFEEMVKYFFTVDIKPDAYVRHINADGFEVGGEFGLVYPNPDAIHPLLDFGDETGTKPFDYLFDVRQFGAPTVNISGTVGQSLTYYWPSAVEALSALGYIEDEEVAMASAEEYDGLAQKVQNSLTS